MVASALQGIEGLSWYAVRNASDPQIKNPTNNLKQAEQEAAQIYAKYGGLTTAGSVITTWAILRAATATGAHLEQEKPGFKLGRLPRERTPQLT